MGEAKRRKELGLPPKQINEAKRRKELGLPPKQIDKEQIKKNVRSTLTKYPFIPFIFYGAALIILVVGVFAVINYYK
tara:strand:- start:1163 stop:1393 length:231 start_codon:yes stop_codon:yes gene_type:complete